MAFTATRRAVLLLISLMTIAFFTTGLRSGRPVYLGMVPAAQTPTQRAPRSAMSKAATAVTRPTTPAPTRLPAVDRILSTRVATLGHPGGQEAAEDNGRQGEDQNNDKHPDQHHGPVAPPSKRASRPATPPEEESQEDQDPKQGEARYDGGPDLPAREVRRDAEGDEHEPGDGREDRSQDDGEDDEKARQPVDTPVHVPEPVLTLLRSLEVAPRVGCRVPGSVRMVRRPDNAGLLVLGRPLDTPRVSDSASSHPTGPGAWPRCRSRWVHGASHRPHPQVDPFCGVLRGPLPVCRSSLPLRHIVGRPSVVQCRFYPASVRGHPRSPTRHSPTG